jgi:hypothetical protein
MTVRSFFLASCAVTVSTLFFHCGNLAGGGGSEWEAKITGQAVYDGSGLPAAGARVVLCPERFLRDTFVAPDSPVALALRETVTDKNGFFSVDRLEPGIFYVEVNNEQSWSSLIKCEIAEHDVMLAISCTLKPTGRISGSLTFPAGYRGISYIQIYGLDRVARAAPDGAFSLGDIPEGTYTLRILPSHPDYIAKDVAAVAVSASAETNLGALTVPLNGGAWSYNRRIYMNTTPSGADVAGDVVGFPVLIRLTGDNFDFTEAQIDGRDIRFTKATGTLLPYEIVRWDGVNKAAEIWVKLDTVRGGNGSQSLTMYWGNANASDGSNGAKVFDTAAGFAGVWHLGETTGASAREATYNGFSGIYNGGLPHSEKGPLGNCQNINQPDKEYIDMGNVLNPGLKSISVGVWIKRGSFVTPQAIVAKTNGDLPSASYGFLLSIDPANAPHFNIASGGANWGDEGAFDIMSNLAITDSTVWHYVFVVINRFGTNNCSMYLDGVDRTGKTVGDITNVTSVSNALNFHIGTESDNNYSYKGAIAEATISFTARSADWIKLCYENQKAHDALLRW